MKRTFSVFLFLGFFASVLSCQKISSSPSEEVARRFLEAYYVKADLAGASHFVDGYALEKVRTSLHLTEGQVKDQSTHYPKVSYSLLESNADGQEAQYLFLIEFHPDKTDRVQKKTLLKVREREGKQWKVTQFSESEGGSEVP